jgi:putative ubiquitin-RnfH superfamily antitoxin RatB of RatAB toxin-antitoxin module
MKSIRVELVEAHPGGARVEDLTLPAGSTLADALAAAGLAARDRVGIFGRLAGRSTVLADGDRIEIYRPLAHDPKEARRRRARRGR